MATRTLRECLEDLPQEIYDEIYSLALTPSRIREVILIEKSYKPPATSQVNRAARKSFKMSCMRHRFIAELEDLMLWLKAQETRWQLVDIRCWVARDDWATWESVHDRLDYHFDMALSRRAGKFRTRGDALRGYPHL